MYNNVIFHATKIIFVQKEIDNTTWHEVKMKIREVQSEQHMCIDKEQLTELDIYHRILRYVFFFCKIYSYIT